MDNEIVNGLQNLHLTSPALRPDPVNFFPNIMSIEAYLAARGVPRLFPQSCLGGPQELEKLREQIFCSVPESLKTLLSSSLGGRLKDAKFKMVNWQGGVTPCVVVLVEKDTVQDWCALEAQIRALFAKSTAGSSLVFEVLFELAKD
ncbi:hypothetical protein PISL3812_07863 [Talaromyces islandicus]|uniref:Uncharacterized protein n=1 Tax=Talaromyces islandicus TaxID=28573 RepID=A0A0U1M5L9_TALIS|nr:hypothetical protein PISL3812_07863 [Talaromyces islandicus]